MKTYSEKNGKKPFDWFKALNKKAEDMDCSETYKLYIKSKDWVTCATGNQCAIIDRNSDGEPIDNVLRRLGGAFYNEVEQMHRKINQRDSFYNAGASQITVEEMVEEKLLLKTANKFRLHAISTLHKIEKRSEMLIKKKIKEIKNTLGEDAFTKV